MFETQPFQILPWNGYPAAISLSFDDGDASQWQTAIPEMAKRGVRGTFYLIGNRLTDIEEWRKAALAGQEIGNHTLDHKHAQDLNEEESLRQIQQNLKKLENSLGVSVPTFAYPFTEITPRLRKAAKDHHFLSRGGYGEVYFSPQQEPDWDYLASQVVYTHTSSGVLKGWTDLNIQNHTWSIPQFHGFEGAQKAWQPLPLKTFIDFLEDLSKRKKEIWIAPVGEVGAYWMSQKIVQEAQLCRSDDRIIYQWKKNPLLPKGIRLKAVSAEQRIFQGGKAISTETDGSYMIDFDQEELTLIPL